MIFVILDAVAGPTKLDISMISWLIHNAYPFNIIVNKIDKVGSSKLDGRKKEIADQLQFSDIFWISLKKKIQISPLQKLIAELLDA